MVARENCLNNSLRAARSRRAAFTLTEVLIVIVIIGIITSLSITAATGFTRRAKIDATQSLINQLHVALQERLDAFYSSTRNNITATAEEKNFAGNAAAPDGSVIGRRAKIIAMLDAQRGEFPQLFREILRQADAVPPAGGFGDMQQRPIRTAILMAYLQKSLVAGAGSMRPQVSSTTPYATGTAYTLPVSHTSITESSECLYLLLSIPVPGSVFDVNQIPIRFVDDSDRDGLKEFVDAWGAPLRFYRSPTDLLAYYIDGTEQLPKTLLKSSNPMDYSVPVLSNNLDPDGMLTEANWASKAGFEQGIQVGGKNQGGFYRLNWPYTIPAAGLPINPIDPTTGPQANAPRVYPVIPMIISAGQDGKFGLIGEANNFADPGPGNATWTSFVCARVDPNMLINVKDNIVNLQLEKGRVR